MKKLPPFSMALKKFLSTGNKPSNDVYLFCGIYAWKKARHFSQHRFSLCLPPYESPSIYQWPVNGCDVLLFETGNLEAYYIEELAYHLLRDGAAIVRAINSDNEIAIYGRSAA